MGKITEGMYVQLVANNYGGYYPLEIGSNGEELSRVYLIYNYSQKTNSFNHLIGVYVRKEDFKEYDSLKSGLLRKDEYMKTVTTINYTRKMTNSEFKELRNDMLIKGIDDVDELEKLIIPFVIGPKEIKEQPKWPKIASLIAIGIGALVLIGSIIGSIINRY